MKNKWIRIVLLTVLVGALAGCGSAENTQATGSQTESDNPISNAAQSTQEPQKDITQMTQPEQLASSGMESLVEEAKAELAQRLSIELTQISLVEAKEVVWPDSSLGCPQPGMKYKQVPEDGVLIVLQTQGSVYEYHIGGSRGLFLCEKGLSKPEKPPQIDITNLTPQILDKNSSPPLTPDQGIPPGEDQ
jgi:hypothetical protein